MSTPFKMKGFSGFGSSPAKQEGHRKYSDLEKYDDDRDDQSKEASFRAAFAKARKAQGPGGTFTWEGKKYTTDRKDDKFVMGQETGEIQTDKKGKKYVIMDADHMGTDQFQTGDTLILPDTVQGDMLPDESWYIKQKGKGKYKPGKKIKYKYD
tara:strand:+ start:588 stop:1046 length:459 start_codon:yes stop_codon:yes gene_type:complete